MLEFLILNIFINDADNNGPTIVKIIIKIYLAENLKVNILIDTKALNIYSILLDLGI